MARSRTVKTTLQAYLSEIGDEKLLTAEEEIELAHKIAKGDKEARDRMIRANLRLVVNIAKNYTNRGLTFSDFIEEGNLGLMTAVERFDPTMGCRFSTYASWWIKRGIRKALLEKVKNIKVPASVIEKIARWKAVEAQYYEETGQKPTYEKIAKKLKMSTRQLRDMTRLMGTSNITGPTLSMELMDPESPEMAEDVSVDDEMRRKLDEALGAINTRDADILCRYYGYGDHDPHTLQKIGDLYGITRERIRQLLNRALRKLQEAMTADED